MLVNVAAKFSVTSFVSYFPYFPFCFSDSCRVGDYYRCPVLCIEKSKTCDDVPICMNNADETKEANCCKFNFIISPLHTMDTMTNNVLIYIVYL